MNSTARLPRPTLLALSLLLLIAVAACSDASAQMTGAAHDEHGPASASTDRPLAGWQEQLIDLAFRTASALPTDPHIKTRSREQEAVVDACLELDQSERALGYAASIRNWRRGTAYADVAQNLARRGETGRLPHLLELAEQVAATAPDAQEQEWRAERIRSAIDRANKAAEPAPAEAGGDIPDFAERLDALDGLAATGNFDELQAALAGYGELHKRVWSDEERRAAVADRIRTACIKLPMRIRLAWLEAMADDAIDHGDLQAARSLAAEARGEADKVVWLPEDRVPVVARLAALRFRAGDAVHARKDADAALSLYGTERARIVDIDRADALIPLAETYHVLRDDEAARSVYAKAAEEGMRNPNSRPRAEDLVAICCSLAVHGVTPDAALLARLRAAEAALGDPW